MMQDEMNKAGAVETRGGRIYRAAALLSLLFASALLSPLAYAAVVFDFNAVPLIGNASNGLGATASSSTIATYMTTALKTQSGVSTAAVGVVGALATKTYNGEGFVQGPTLGPDTFIINNNFGLKPKTTSGSDFSGTKYDYFQLTFSNYLVSSISFDYEIFPDATCPAGSTCAKSNQTSSSWPDIEVWAGNGSLTKYWQKLAPVPSNPNTKAPQDIGTMTLFFPSPVSVLKFVDWPAEIGIDNLKLNTVPEPGSLSLLLLAAIAGLVTAQRRRGRAA